MFSTSGYQAQLDLDLRQPSMTSAKGANERPHTLHIFHWDPKFFPPFHAFLRSHFSVDGHDLLVEGAPLDHQLPDDVKRLRTSARPVRIAEYWGAIASAQRVVLHGIFDLDLRLALALRPKLAGKCSWLPWGGDLYWATTTPRTLKRRIHRGLFRHAVSHFAELLTYLPADVEVARQVLGFRGQHRRCLMYESNVVSDQVLSYLPVGTSNPTDSICIFVGNSATPSCLHNDAFEALLPIRERGAKVYCALNYGDADYRRQTIDEGHRLFGSNFIPLTHWMHRCDFEVFLSQMDIGVFAHERQQGMGTAIAMFGLGKRVLLRAGTSQAKYFKGINLTFSFLDEPELSPLSLDHAEQNRAVVRQHHSAASYLDSWKTILL